MQRTTDVVRRFRNLRILVVGDVMLDSYYEGTASRLCTEGPVPVVRRTAELRQPGGAGNTAANIAALGAEVRLVGVVGQDATGAALKSALRQRGVSDEWLVEDACAETIHKLRILADGQYVVRFDEGDTSRPSSTVIELFLESVDRAIAECDAILISDYTFGAINSEFLKRLPELRYRHDVPLVVDSKDLARFAGTGATVVTPNLLEASLLVNRAAADGSQDVAALGRGILRLVDAEYAAVTLGMDGVSVVGRDGTSHHISTHPIQRASDVGAGDTFAAALCLALGCGAEMLDAVHLGIDAAAIVVSKPHTAMVSYQELLQQVSLREHADQTDSEHASTDALLAQLDADRSAGKRIVFTNGVFDILHAGHVEFLRQAKALGDVLVVAINTDRSARYLKGPNRPINGQRDRMALISALGPVDHTIYFDDHTPTELIRQLRPDIHVKGGDHAGVELPEAATVQETGGEVVILPLVGNLSTSSMIDRIVSLAFETPAEAEVAVD